MFATVTATALRSMKQTYFSLSRTWLRSSPMACRCGKW